MTPAEAFTTLGLPSDATSEQVTKAWRRACMKHHPDRGGNQYYFLQAKEAHSIAMMHVSARVCPTCNGKGKVPINVGLTVLTLRCPTCLKKRNSK